MKEYVLKTPIVIGDETISCLKFEEPTLQKLSDCKVDLSEAGLKSADGMMRLIEACTVGKDSAFIGRMKFSDVSGAVEACAGFFS